MLAEEMLSLSCIGRPCTAKSANIIQNFFSQKCKIRNGFKKTQNLMLISNPLKKMQKVISEKVTEKLSF
jgi:hypothetical protein